jgi:hypothetical protein
MSLLPIDLKGKAFPGESEAQSHERVLSRLEDLGGRLINTGDMGDPRKRAYACQLIGYAFVTAFNLIVVNREKVEAIADAVYEQKEIYGDELVRLLDAQNFVKPEIDWTAEESWPKIMYYTKLHRDVERERVELERASGIAAKNGHDDSERMM